MKKIEHFKRELDLIINEDLRMTVKSYLAERVPSIFWATAASATGKYHPIFSQGVGGLVRHTKAVVCFAEEILALSSYSYLKPEYKDYIITACIVHDTAKYGLTEEFDKSAYKDHAKNASILFGNWHLKINGCPASEMLLNAISAHMGQWSTDKEDKPFTSIDRAVHMADYMASRRFIDVPYISCEWSRVENGEGVL